MAGVILLSSAMLSGCGGFDQEAAGELATHYALHGYPGWSDTASIVVVDVLEPSESIREVRHRIRVEWTDSTGTLRSDTGEVATARFTRSTSGWALSGYDAKMVEIIGWLTYYRVLEGVQPLLTELRKLEAEARRLESQYNDRLVSALQRDDYRAFSRLTDSRGIAVANIVVDVDSAYQWGVSEMRNNYDQVVWVRLASDTTFICAERLIQGEDDAWYDWMWLDGHRETCRRGYQTLPISSIHDSVTAFIARRGDVLHEPLYVLPLPGDSNAIPER